MLRMIEYMEILSAYTALKSENYFISNLKYFLWYTVGIKDLTWKYIKNKNDMEAFQNNSEMQKQKNWLLECER